MTELHSIGIPVIVKLSAEDPSFRVSRQEHEDDQVVDFAATIKIERE